MVLPWSIGLIGLFAAAQLLLAWAIEREVVHSGQRRIAARVEVGDTRVNLLGSRVALDEIHVANPLSPLRNLVEADHCVFQLDPAELLHKRAVVRYGAITGLRFGTTRETSGALPDVEASGDTMIDGWLDETATKQAQDWLDRLHQRFDRNLLEELESIRLADELLARWPELSNALEERIAQLRKRASEFHAKIRDAQENPLRNAEFLQRLPREINTIRDQVAALGQEIADLPQVAEEDRRVIVAAREHDERLLSEEFQIEPIDTNILSAYLLQKQLRGPLSDLVGWLRFVRRIVPENAELADSKTGESHHHRGREILFTGCRRTPDFLLRKLKLQGTTQFAGQSIELDGILSDVTDKPALHDRPIRLQLAARGTLPLDVQATIDRTGKVARDELIVDCGGIVLPKISLGRSKKLRLSLAPTIATLNVRITLEGDKLSGDVELVQRQVQITPTVGAALVRRNFDVELTKVLADVDTLSTRVTLAGTLERPRCHVSSNLGPAVAEAIGQALARTIAGYTNDVLAESHNRVDQCLAELDDQIADAQSALAPQLEDTTDSLDLLTRKTTTERLSIDHLGRRLPADSLFR
jgi:uncharacterized protein (TIGR03545 family)